MATSPGKGRTLMIQEILKSMDMMTPSSPTFNNEQPLLNSKKYIQNYFYAVSTNKRSFIMAELELFLFNPNEIAK